MTVCETFSFVLRQPRDSFICSTAAISSLSQSSAVSQFILQTIISSSHDQINLNSSHAEYFYVLHSSPIFILFKTGLNYKTRINFHNVILCSLQPCRLLVVRERCCCFLRDLWLATCTDAQVWSQKVACFDALSVQSDKSHMYWCNSRPVWLVHLHGCTLRSSLKGALWTTATSNFA